MAEPLAMDSGPLIALAQANALDLLGRLPFEFVCPPQVRAELDQGAAMGYPAIQGPWLMVRPLTESLRSTVGGFDLDPGEAAVIQLAREQGIARVCIDEKKGRQAALAVGLQVLGSLGLLIRAKRLGLVPEIRPLIDRAVSQGYQYGAEPIRKALDAVGE